MLREHARLWRDLPPQIKQIVYAPCPAAFPEIVRQLTDEIGRNIDQLSTSS